jgi:signal transduction histidine kinase
MEQAASEQLRSYSRLKQEFLSNVSHELRTPITAIQGYLSLLGQGSLGTLNQEQSEALQIALRNVDRLKRLVNDVLDFSSLTRGQFAMDAHRVEMTAVLRQALQRTDESARLKGIPMQRDFPDALGCVLGNEEKLTHIVAHLLENAIKFSEPTQPVVLSAMRRRPQLVIEVQDHGAGMTEEQLQSVFTPFVQGDSGLSRRYGGLGMGLSLIQNLVLLHGGEIKIHSQPRRGTTVLVSLPLQEKEE